VVRGGGENGRVVRGDGRGGGGGEAGTDGDEYYRVIIMGYWHTAGG